MKAGDVNFLFSQAEYQKTPKIKFKVSKIPEPRKLYEKVMFQLIFYALLIEALQRLLTYIARCLH